MKESKKERIEELEFSIMKLEESRDDKIATICILDLEVDAIEERLITLKKEIKSIKKE